MTGRAARLLAVFDPFDVLFWIISGDERQKQVIALPLQQKHFIDARRVRHHCLERKRQPPSNRIGACLHRGALSCFIACVLVGKLTFEVLGDLVRIDEVTRQGNDATRGG